MRALQISGAGCYLIAVTRLLTLLMMFVLVVANGPAVAAAICEHHDARAHQAAAVSSDSGIAADALDEESAAKAASLEGAFGDAAGTLLAGCLLPDELCVPPRTVEGMARHLAQPVPLASQSLTPLLEPPLA